MNFRWFLDWILDWILDWFLYWMLDWILYWSFRLNFRFNFRFQFHRAAPPPGGGGSSGSLVDDGHGAGGQLHQLFAALANIEIRSDGAKCNKLLFFRAKNEGSVCHKKRAETESEAKIERMPVLNKDETRTFNCLQRRSTHAKTKSNLFSSCVAKI